jgi:hypothetical protein
MRRAFSFCAEARPKLLPRMSFKEPGVLIEFAAQSGVEVGSPLVAEF